MSALSPSSYPPRLLLASALALAAAEALSATPDAGQIVQEPRAPVSAPAATAPALLIDKPTSGAVAEGGPLVRLAGIQLLGNTAFTTEALQALLADALGRDLSFADLTRLADRITRHYRSAGYLVARAYLPAQQLKAGVLDIAVLEGTLGRVELRNTAGLSASALAPLQRLPPDAPVQQQSLEPMLLNLADLPGTTVQSTLRPGTAVGASDLLVEVSRARALQGSVDLDNYGSIHTGEYRAGASLFWNNPLDRGDQLSLRLQASDAQLRYQRLAYQLPLGDRATRVGVALSNMSYRLGQAFEALDAHGTAAIASLYLRQPLLRSQAANWYAQLQFDAKKLRDIVGSTATTSRHDLRNAVIGLNGNWQDAIGAGGSNVLAVNVTAGRLSLDADTAAQDAASARTAGNFVKLGYQAERLQALSPGWALALDLSGQLADKNLASAERFSLGGSQGVRAYPQGEASGDAGWLARVELRWQVAPSWQLQAFGDAGSVTSNQKPWTDGANRRRLAGVGLGVSWSADNMSFTLAAAQATDRESPRPEPQRSPRVWAQASAGF